MAGNSNSGRRPQSAAMKILRGNPGGRRLNTKEPAVARPGADFDTSPSDLDDDPVAAAEWRRLAPVLRTSGLVTVADSAVLLAACEQWSVYRDAQRRLRDEGLTSPGDRGQVAIHPYYRIADRALKACTLLWRELGLTPQARSRLIAVPPADPAVASKWAGLI